MATYATVMTIAAWDPFVERQVRRLRARVKQGETYVLANETDGDVAVPDDIPKVRVTEADVVARGLPRAHDASLFCFNLDYLYAHFHRMKPDFDYYVFLDNAAVADVDIDALIARVADAELDMVAEPVPGPIADWVYTKPHAALYPPDEIKAVMLPMIVLSRAAIAHLASRRLELARHYADRADFFWPFCEAFVPTELARGGFTSAPLSRFGAVDAFRWWPPMLETELATDRPAGFVHPVLDRPRYLRYLLQHTSSTGLLDPRLHRRILSQIPASAYVGPLAAALASRAKRAFLSRMPRRAA